jgi:hypothetical protein
MTKLEELAIALDATKTADDDAWGACNMALSAWEDLFDIKSGADPKVQELWLEVKKAEDIWSDLHRCWQVANLAYEDELKKVKETNND